MTSPADLATVKKVMIESQGNGDGYIVPLDIQAELKKQLDAGNQNGIRFAHTKYGLTIFNLFDAPWHTYRIGSFRGVYQVLRDDGMDKECLALDTVSHILDTRQEAALREAGEWQDSPP